MNPRRRNLPEHCLAQLGFRPCDSAESLGLDGICYKPPEEFGEGYYWYYEREGLFAITLLDMRLKKDFVLEYQRQNLISINYYDTVSAEELSPYKRISANRIHGHVSDSELFRARYHKNVPIHGIEFMLMPGYYLPYLQRNHPGEFADPKAAFMGVEGVSDLPDLAFLLHQIQSFRGVGMLAHLFYDRKASEAASIIINKTRTYKRPDLDSVTDEDLVNLDAVKCYIDDHFAFSIRTEQLTRIARMGQTRLRCLFKELYGYTITEFIQNKRVAYAEYMLAETDRTIGQITQAVGYRHAGRFTSLFKKNTGLFPDEYRRLFADK